MFKKVCQNQNAIPEVIDCQIFAKLTLSLILEFELSHGSERLPYNSYLQSHFT